MGTIQRAWKVEVVYDVTPRGWAAAALNEERVAAVIVALVSKKTMREITVSTERVEVKTFVPLDAGPLGLERGQKELSALAQAAWDKELGRASCLQCARVGCPGCAGETCEGPVLP